MADIVGVLLRREGAGSGADLRGDQSTSFFSSALGWASCSWKPIVHSPDLVNPTNRLLTAARSGRR